MALSTNKDGHVTETGMEKSVSMELNINIKVLDDYEIEKYEI